MAGLGLGIASALLLTVGCSSDDVEKAFTVTFEAPAGSGHGSSEVDFESFLPVLFYDFTLPGSVVVDGLVSDGAGAPLAGADLAFLSTRTGMPMGTATTDGLGNYSTELAPGYYDILVDSGTPAVGGLLVTHVVVPSGAPHTQDVAFPPTVALGGTVFEEVGSAIPNATLLFVGTQTGAIVNATADGFGDYAVALAPDTYNVLVTAAGAAALSQVPELFSLTVSADGTRDFQLSEGVIVTGVVRDDLGGALLEASEVEILLPDGTSFFAPGNVNVNPADGTYAIGPLPDGNSTFRIKPPGDTGFPVQDFAVSILGGGPQAEDFSLLAGFLLTGSVMQEGGIAPEELVNILPIPLDGSVPPRNALTDVAGNYAVSLFPGQYDVSFLPELANLQLPELQTLNITGDTLFDLDLTTGAMLTGIVTEPGGVVPAPDVLVQIPGLMGAQSITDAAGSYSFLAPLGTHDLVLAAMDGSFEDFALADVTGVDVLGGTNLDFSLAFEVLGTTIVEGTVFEPDGTTPAAGVLLTATDVETGEVLGKMLTDVNGDYTLIVR